MLQEIDSIEVSTAAAAPADDGIDGIPIPADSGAVATVVTTADSEKNVSTKVSQKTPSQPANGVDSGDEEEWKDVPPQGLITSDATTTTIQCNTSLFSALDWPSVL